MCAVSDICSGPIVDPRQLQNTDNTRILYLFCPFRADGKVLKPAAHRCACMASRDRQRYALSSRLGLACSIAPAKSKRACVERALCGRLAKGCNNSKISTHVQVRVHGHTVFPIFSSPEPNRNTKRRMAVRAAEHAHGLKPPAVLRHASLCFLVPVGQALPPNSRSGWSAFAPRPKGRLASSLHVFESTLALAVHRPWPLPALLCALPAQIPASFSRDRSRGLSRGHAPWAARAAGHCGLRPLTPLLLSSCLSRRTHRGVGTGRWNGANLFQVWSSACRACIAIKVRLGCARAPRSRPERKAAGMAPARMVP